MKTNDPLAITTAVAAFVLAVILPGHVPARRAARVGLMAALPHQQRIDPATALRVSRPLNWSHNAFSMKGRSGGADY
jgi:hypothetical protein